MGIIIDHSLFVVVVDVGEMCYNAVLQQELFMLPQMHIVELTK
jgi:hypothetical protein